MSCKQRVWASGDMDSCGEPTLPGHTYCIAHRVAKLQELRQKIAEHDKSKLSLECALTILLKEGQA